MGKLIKSLKSGEALSVQTIRYLKTLYPVAAVTIFLIIIVGQVLVQSFLQDQKGDARLINVAGRQRMLSQKLVKEFLLYQGEPSAHNLTQIRSTYKQFFTAHESLEFGDKALGVVVPDYTALEESMLVSINTDVEVIESLVRAVVEGEILTANELQQLLLVESSFLVKMDEFVFQLDKKASLKIDSLKNAEYALMAIALLVLVFEIFFFFMPLTKRIVGTIKALFESEKVSHKRSLDLEEAYGALELSHQTLGAINKALDESTLFAIADKEGKVTQVSNTFLTMLGLEEKDVIGNMLSVLLSSNLYKSKFVAELVAFFQHDQTFWSGNVQASAGEALKYLQVTIAPVYNSDKSLQQLLLMCQDTTVQELAKQELEALEKEQMNEALLAQKHRSVHVLEAQEEERRRIARDIHDGIGQYLTALKFNLASIKSEHLADIKIGERIDLVKSLLKETILEVRRVSFNLTPNELSDYGLIPALKNYVIQMEKVTPFSIVFENLSNYSERLDVNIEQNIYRIVQEAVNNAVKYAKPNLVSILISQVDDVLRISVEDDGKGFDANKVLTKDIFKISGHGLFNMKERASFIDAKFNIETAPTRGTKVIIEVPI